MRVVLAGCESGFGLRHSRVDTDSGELRVLIIADHASTRFGGEAALPFHYFKGLRARGIEAWLLLGDAVGLRREDLLSHRFLLPGVRFAIDAYLDFARRQPWEVAASSSLTELFAPNIHQSRLDTWPEQHVSLDTAPEDFSEFLDEAGTLAPLSLFEEQLARRTAQ